MSTRRSKRVAAVVAKAPKAEKVQPPAKETPLPRKEKGLEMKEASGDSSSDDSEDSGNISDSSSDSDNDDPTYVRAIRGVDWLKANKAPEPFETVPEEVRQKEVEASDGSGSRSRVGSGEEEELSDSDSDTANILLSRFQYVEPFVSKKGNTFYRCSLCPSKGPFASEGAVLDFMKGKYFRNVLRKTTRLLNPKASKTEVEIKERVDKKKAKRQEKRKAKTQELTAEQIQRRKEKFQRKKARREERKRSSDLPK